MELASVQCWQLLTSHSGTQYWCRRLAWPGGWLSCWSLCLIRLPGSKFPPAPVGSVSPVSGTFGTQRNHYRSGSHLHLPVG